MSEVAAWNDNKSDVAGARGGGVSTQPKEGGREEGGGQEELAWKERRTTQICGNERAEQHTNVHMALRNVINWN